MSNRAAAEKFILGYIKDLVGESSPTYAIYKKRFAEIDDETFDAYMRLCRDKREILPSGVRNMNKNEVTIKRALEVGKKYGFPFFQRIYLTDQKTGQLVLRDRPTRLYLIPNRRQAETLSAKISIPKNNNTKDQLTNQPTGDSKGSTWSQPEMQATLGRSMPNVNRELMQARGGDDKKFNAMNRMLLETGTVSLEQLPEDSKAKSVSAVGVILTAMHLQNNLDEG